MFIPDPGSKFFSIPDPASSRVKRFPDLLKKFKYFNPKNCFQALGNMIQILIFYPFRILESKRHRDPGSATLRKRQAKVDIQQILSDGLHKTGCSLHRAWFSD
jgi:hypothetical protein